MTEHSPEVGSTPDEPQHKSDSEQTESVANGASVEFSIADTNHDYAKGVFLRQARSLQSDFVELYREDPSGKFRLTLERL